MADAPQVRGTGGPAPDGARPPRVLTPDEELRLLKAHAELSGDLAEAARLQTACDPLEQTQENPELPVLLRARDALAPSAPRRADLRRLRRWRRVAAAILGAVGVALVVVALLTRPG